MPNDYKILGQAALTGTVPTDIYTVPSSTDTIVSTIVVANLGTVATSYSLGVSFQGTAIASKDYLAKDQEILGNESYTWTIGATLGPADKLRGYVTAGTVAFNAFGQEIT